MEMKSHLVLLPRVTLLDKELVQWKTESENISFALQCIVLFSHCHHHIPFVQIY